MIDRAPQEALEAIGKIPDDTDMDEIMYRLYVPDARIQPLWIAATRSACHETTLFTCGLRSHFAQAILPILACCLPMGALNDRVFLDLSQLLTHNGKHATAAAFRLRIRTSEENGAIRRTMSVKADSGVSGLRADQTTCGQAR